MQISMELFNKKPSHEIMLRKMVVYLIRYKADGRGYVGKTTRTLRERIREHLRSHRTYSHIDNAARKYGAENFEVMILEECQTKEELNLREMFWIKELNTKYPNGSNLTDGSEGIPGYKAPPELSKRLSEMRKGRPNTPKQRKQISETLKGRKFSEEHKANISAAKLCHPVSKETRDILRAINTGKKYSLETRQKKSASCKRKRAVRCIELNKIFESITAASKWAGIAVNTILTACKKKNRTAAGYHWEYLD